MARVRLWVSGVSGIGNVFVIEHDEGGQYCQPLKSPPAQDERVGTVYQGEFRGYPGTYYDLPCGFPANNEQARLRLADPSIPKPMQKLLRENFPLKTMRFDNKTRC
ncbi:MAG: hypothetical protein JWM11_2360 [Planctomycetaceae bacterium]|nr:hypothetical protein [Planctomycetaceae bacterium]